MKKARTFKAPGFYGEKVEILHSGESIMSPFEVRVDGKPKFKLFICRQGMAIFQLVKDYGSRELVYCVDYQPPYRATSEAILIGLRGDVSKRIRENHKRIVKRKQG